MHNDKLVSGVATVCMRATYLHRVNVGECPGGRIFNGRFGGSCCKAAHAQAGADMAVLHLQMSDQVMLQGFQPHLMCAHMQVEAHSIVHAPSGCHAGRLHGIRSLSTRHQIFTASGTQAMALAGLASG